MSAVRRGLWWLAKLWRKAASAEGQDSWAAGRMKALEVRLRAAEVTIAALKACDEEHDARFDGVLATMAEAARAAGINSPGLDAATTTVPMLRVVSEREAG